MKKVIGLIVIIILLAGGAIYTNSHKSNSGSLGQDGSVAEKKEELPRINFMAPRFTLSSLNGKTYSLKEGRGKPVMINFWASWCGPCKLEAPEIASLYKKYKGKFTLYAINLTKTESSLADVKGFADQYGYSFPILLDKNGDVAKKYFIKPIPTTYFINSNGIIVDQILGYGGQGALTTKLKTLISGSDNQ